MPNLARNGGGVVFCLMSRRKSLVLFVLLVTALGSAPAAKAATIFYDGLTGTTFTGNSSSVDLTRTVGAALNLSSAGTLTVLGWTLCNPFSFQSTGPILAGTFLIKVYDNTTP